MTRLSTGAFAVLVAATIAAFFVTQHLKVTTPLIQGAPRPVPGVIDPLHGVPCVGGKNSGSTTISFYLQHRADTVDVYVVDAEDDQIVRTVADGRHMRIDVRNPDGVFHWNGREDNGEVAPDGTYYFRVALLAPGAHGRPQQPPGEGQDRSTAPDGHHRHAVDDLSHGRRARDDPVRGQREPRRDDPDLPHGSPRGPATGQDVPDALERPYGSVGRHDRRASRAARYVSDRDRGHATPLATPVATPPASARRPRAPAPPTW